MPLPIPCTGNQAIHYAVTSGAPYSTVWKSAFVVQDDGSGPQLVEWNLPGIAAPTAGKLAEAGTADTWRATTGQQRERREAAKAWLATSNDPVAIAIRVAFKGIGASLRDVRGKQVPPLPNRTDAQFISDLLAAIDAGAGDV